MKRINIILITLVIIGVSVSFLLWQDIYRQKQLIRNKELSNIESSCYEEILFYTELLDFFAAKNNISKKDFFSFFEYKSNYYLAEIDKSDFEFKSALECSKESSSLVFDEILQLKSTKIFFLFKDNIFVKSIRCCNEDGNLVNVYIQSKGNFGPED